MLCHGILIDAPDETASRLGSSTSMRTMNLIYNILIMAQYVVGDKYVYIRMHPLKTAVLSVS